MKLTKGHPDIPDAIPAQASADGSIPARAFQFCEPFIAANRIGVLVYPPVDFSLFWTGSDILIRMPEINDWILLDRVFLPNFHDHWVAHAPQNAHTSMPTFAEAFPERGVVQLWSGYFLSTQEGDSTWVRGPINQQQSDTHYLIEGIVETDWWTGPLFTNIQITKTDRPVKFEVNRPLMQVFTVPAVSHRRNAEPPQIIEHLPQGDTQFWNTYVENTYRRNSEKPGSYRRISRSRELQ